MCHVTHVFHFCVFPLLRPEPELAARQRQRRGQPPPLMAISPNSSGIKGKCLFNHLVLKIGFTKPDHAVHFLLVKIAEDSVVQIQVD